MDQNTVTIAHQFHISSALAGQRLDRVLAHLLPQYSRSLIKQWIDDHGVKRNGKVCRPRDMLVTGDEIVLQVTVKDRTVLLAEAIHLDIIEDNEEFLVLNKPVGLVVHPGNGHWAGTLVNALLHHDSNLKQLPRAGLIHRLDKDTSGLLVVAKTLNAHTALVDQLQRRVIERRYYALVQGEVISGGKIELPIGRHPQLRTKMAVVAKGKSATTHYRVAQRFPAYTLLDIQLETGRTHQIRVHMAHLGYPLVGDNVYNARSQLPKKCPHDVRLLLQTFKRQALHAYRLGLYHPVSSIWQEWSIPLPLDIENLLAVLEQWQ